jgi:hypothetical protein
MLPAAPVFMPQPGLQHEELDQLISGEVSRRHSMHRKNHNDFHAHLSGLG